MAEPTPDEQKIILRLERQAQGLKVDPYAPPFEVPPTPQEAFQAATQLAELKRAIEARGNRDQDFELSKDKLKHEQQMEESMVRLEIARLELATQTERGRLDLEFAKLEIQKAEVIVRAIEAASRNPDAGRLTEVAETMSTKLLNRNVLPAIEEKK